jgi:hypothetical protein
VCDADPVLIRLASFARWKHCVTPWSASTQNHARVQTVMRRRVRDYRPLLAKGGERGANDLWQDFFSPRIGCRLQHPVHGIDLGTLCQRATSGQS